jgi:hypothetical protein
MPDAHRRLRSRQAKGRRDAEADLEAHPARWHDLTPAANSQMLPSSR